MRQAIGQLLEYGFWPESLKPSRLVVCGEPAADAETMTYLAVINARFPAPVEYRQVVI